MLQFPDSSTTTEYTDPNGDKWEFNGTGWVRQPAPVDDGSDGSNPLEVALTDVLIYDHDGITSSTANMVQWPAGEDWSSGGAPFFHNVNNDNENWLTMNKKGDADQAFYWMSLEGGTSSAPITAWIRIPYPSTVGGNIHRQFEFTGLSYWSCVSEENVAYVATDASIVKVERTGANSGSATKLATFNSQLDDGEWIQDGGVKRFFDGQAAYHRPFILNVSDDALDILVTGKNKNTNLPHMKQMRISKADGSVISTSTLMTNNLTVNKGATGTDTYTQMGWVRDPRNPADAVGFFLYGRNSATATPAIAVVHYRHDMERFYVHNMDCTNSTLRRYANSFSTKGDFTAVDVNTFCVSWPYTNASNQAWNGSFVFSLPPNRGTMQDKINFGYGGNRIYNATGKNGESDYTPYGHIPGRYLQHVAQSGATITSLTDATNFAVYPNQFGRNITYDSILTQSSAKVVKTGVDTGNSNHGHYHNIGTIGIAPNSVYFNGGTDSTAIKCLGIRSDTGALIYQRYYRDKSVFIGIWEPNETSTLRIKVVDGEASGKPVLSNSEPEVFAVGEWMDVRAIADPLEENQKHDDGTFEVDQENNVVIWTRKAVPMTDEEIRAVQEFKEEQNQ